MIEEAKKRKFAKNELLNAPVLLWDMIKRAEYFGEITGIESNELTEALRNLQIEYHRILDKSQKTLK